MAAEPIRWIMGGVCLIFVLAIFGSWLPRVIPWLLKRPRKSTAQSAALFVFALLPVAIGIGPLLVLVALIRNPMAYVYDSGVTKESVFSQTPVSLNLGRDCPRLVRNGARGRAAFIHLRLLRRAKNRVWEYRGCGFRVAACIPRGSVGACGDAGLPQGVPRISHSESGHDAINHGFARSVRHAKRTG